MTRSHFRSGRLRLLLLAALFALLALGFARTRTSDSVASTASASARADIPAPHRAVTAVATDSAPADSTPASPPPPASASDLPRLPEAELPAAIQTALQHDAQSTARLVVALPPSPLRDDALRTLAQEWTHLDPAAAILWASTLPSPEAHSTFAYVCQQMVLTVPEEAVRMWSDFESAPDDAVGENLVLQWASQDAAAALDWVSQQTPGLRRDRGLARVAFAIGQTQPALAMNLVIAQMSEGPARDDALVATLHQWTQRDPEGAHRWLESLQPGAFAERAQAEWQVASTAR